MNAPAPRAPLGFGGAVGLGAAAALLLAVIVLGRAVLGQAEGAVRVVITFAEIALCTLLGALALAVLIALVLGVQLARQHLAERRATSIAATPVMRAEVLEDGARAAVPQGTQRAIQGKSPVSAIGQQQITGGADDWEEARQWL